MARHTVQLVPIPPDKLEGEIGSWAHVSGCSPGTVWRLLSVRRGVAHLETSKTGRGKWCMAHLLYYSRGRQPEQGDRRLRREDEQR